MDVRGIAADQSARVSRFRRPHAASRTWRHSAVGRSSGNKHRPSRQAKSISRRRHRRPGPTTHTHTHTAIICQTDSHLATMIARRQTSSRTPRRDGTITLTVTETDAGGPDVVRDGATVNRVSAARQTRGARARRASCRQCCFYAWVAR